MNVVALVGRLTRDPDLRYTPNGIATCTFNLAVDNPFAKQEPKADFLQIVAWKQTAEACANYLRKGRMCSVEGRIATRNYEKDGHKVYVTEVMANNVRFLEKAENGSKPPDSKPTNDAPMDIFDDDLPF